MINKSIFVAGMAAILCCSAAANAINCGTPPGKTLDTATTFRTQTISTANDNLPTYTPVISTVQSDDPLVAARANLPESRAVEDTRTTDSNSKWVDLYFCPGDEWNDSCIELNLQVTDGYQFCFDIPDGYLKKGQSMWAQGFSCRAFTGVSCAVGDSRELAWFTGHVLITESAHNTVWHTYQCKLGDP